MRNFYNFAEKGNMLNQTFKVSFSGERRKERRKREDGDGYGYGKTRCRVRDVFRVIFSGLRE